MQKLLLTKLAKNFITPNDVFFVRNHLPVPKISIPEYRLTITGNNLETTELTLPQLKTLFKKHTITATISCAGNRRTEMSSIKPVRGLEWQLGAIGNAIWSGALLKDVLRYAKVNFNNLQNIQHVQFEGLDHDDTQAYGASIPITSIDQVLLAYQMNQATLPLDHGFPVRVIVPGSIGARSVKWLAKIILSEQESSSFWQQIDYKFIPESLQNYDISNIPAIQNMPVQSSILFPQTGDTIDKDKQTLTIYGYAFSGNGKIIRVEVSVDNGKNWILAEFIPPINNKCSWQHWKLTCPLPKKNKSLQIICRACDETNNLQPEHIASIWNVRGFMCNAWHRITCKIV